MRISALPDRSGRFRRVVAAALAALYLTLALGAGRHAGDHVDGPLEWLPTEYHHHVFHVDQGSERRALLLADECLACQLTRLAKRLPPRDSRSAPRALSASLTEGAVAIPPSTRPGPRTTRGPPPA